MSSWFSRFLLCFQNFTNRSEMKQSNQKLPKSLVLNGLRAAFIPSSFATV